MNATRSEPAGPMRLPAAFLGLFLVAALTALAGCGLQTGDANDLVHQAGAAVSSASAKTSQVDSLLNQAATLSDQQQFNAEKTALAQASSLLQAAIPQIQGAKTKIDRAAKLNISAAYRQYLQAKGKALDEAVKLRQTEVQKIDLMAQDPGFSNPGTQQKFAQLEQQENSLNNSVQDDENQASQIARQHPDEIK